MQMIRLCLVVVALVGASVSVSADGILGSPIAFTKVRDEGFKTFSIRQVPLAMSEVAGKPLSLDGSSSSSSSSSSAGSVTIRVPSKDSSDVGVNTPAQVDRMNPYSKIKGTGGSAKAPYVLSAAYSASLPEDVRTTSKSSMFAPLLVAGCVASALAAIGFVVVKRRRIALLEDDNDSPRNDEDASPSADVGSSSLYSVLTPTPMLSAV